MFVPLGNLALEALVPADHFYGLRIRKIWKRGTERG
jgi:hypothetical protein